MLRESGKKCSAEDAHGKTQEAVQKTQQAAKAQAAEVTGKEERIFPKIDPGSREESPQNKAATHKFATTVDTEDLLSRDVIAHLRKGPDRLVTLASGLGFAKRYNRIFHQGRRVNNGSWTSCLQSLQHVHVQAEANGSFKPSSLVTLSDSPTRSRPSPVGTASCAAEAERSLAGAAPDGGHCPPRKDVDVQSMRLRVKTERERWMHAAGHSDTVTGFNSKKAWRPKKPSPVDSRGISATLLEIQVDSEDL